MTRSHLPRIYGHRGARGVMPENTLPAVRYLRDIGVDAVEIDVQNTRDGVSIVIHDPLIPDFIARDQDGARLAAPGPKIVETTLEQLRTYDLGDLDRTTEYGQRFVDQAVVPGTRVPTLAEVCALVQAAPGFRLNVEIKSYAHRDDLGASPEALVDTVVHDTAALAGSNQLIVSSFDWRVLRVLRNRTPHIPVGYLSLQSTKDATITDGSPWMDGLSLKDHGGSLPRLVAAQGAAAWCPYVDDVTADAVQEAQALGLEVNVWTVNDPDDIRAMIDMGVDGIITDFPERVQSLLV